MKIITRYILGLFFRVFFIALALMIAGFVFFLVTEATVNRKVPLYLSIRVIPFILPYILTIALPMSTLLGCSMVYAKMAGSNEIIALKAIGVAPFRIFLPVWIVSFLVSLFAVWMNDAAMTWGRRESTRVTVEGFEATILGILASDHVYLDRQNGIEIKVSDVTEDGRLVKPIFSGQKFPGSVAAESGRLTIDFSTPTPSARIELTDMIYKADRAIGLMPRNQTFEYPLPSLASAVGSSSEPKMSEIGKAVNRIEAEKDRSRRRLAAIGGFALATGNIEVAGDSRWSHQKAMIREYDRQITRIRLARPRRLSAGFACFFFAWVGVPLASLSRRGDGFSSFFACFLPILIIYYPLLMFGVKTAKAGTLPPEVCWIGNLVLGVVGFFLLKKIHRH